ncbi:hypothetical protein Brsp07_03404 [Brucella sp. NBRC 14130]
MLNTKLIIVFGVSGIGKTTACANYASRNSNVAHFMASALLSLHRETAGTRTIDKAMQDQRKRCLGITLTVSRPEVAFRGVWRKSSHMPLKVTSTHDHELSA